MFIIYLLRIIIFITFLLLVVEGIAAVIWAKWFSANYVRKHRALEERVSAIERRMKLVEP